MTPNPASQASTATSKVHERPGGLYRSLFPLREGPGFFRTWLRNLWLIVGLSLGVAFVVHYLGWFHSFESLALDSLLLTQSSRHSDKVVLVTIDDKDFASADLFNNTSPLDPEKLGLILKAIAAGHPRVIAVDIDTSSIDRKDEYRRLAEMVRGEDGPPIIWSVDGKPTSDQHGGHGGPTLKAIPPLGGNKVSGSGLIAMPRNLDGVVRRYYRHFSATDESHHEPIQMDSLPWTVVKEYCRKTPDGQLSARLQQIKNGSLATDESPELLMNFLGDGFTFTHITTNTVLESNAKRQEFWSSKRSPIHEKIVLLGGTYKAARDVHPTPAGQKPGVELLAMAIESELEATGIRKIDHPTSILIDMLFGSLLVYLNWRFVTPRSIFFNLLAVMFLALVASYVTFNALGYWLNSAVVLIGVWLHHQYEVIREIPHLHHEIHELKKKLQAYELPQTEQAREPVPSKVIEKTATSKEKVAPKQDSPSA